MTPDKRAFEALLDELLGASFDQDWPAEKKARAAVLAAYEEAAGREGQYLADGMRFKLAATRSGAAAEFRSFPAGLAGKWVALVDATDDKHLRTHPAPKSDESRAIAACCGRSECGGECGNEWRGMEPAPKADAEGWYRWTDMDGYERITKGLPSVDHCHPDSIPQRYTHAAKADAAAVRDVERALRNVAAVSAPIAENGAGATLLTMWADRLAASPARGGDVKPEEEWRYIACSERSALDKNTFVDGFVRAAYYLGLVNEAAMSREAQDT